MELLEINQELQKLRLSKEEKVKVAYLTGYSIETVRNYLNGQGTFKPTATNILQKATKIANEKNKQ